jgi:hypothetical protein
MRSVTMNPANFRWALLLAAAFCIPACGATQQAALRVVDELEIASGKREKAYFDLVEQLVNLLYEERLSRLECWRKVKLAESECHILTLTDTEITTVSQGVLDHLDQALGPVVFALKKDLETEQEKIRTGQGGSREREIELASQYGAILAVASKEAMRLQEKVRSEFRKVKDASIADLTARVNEVPKAFDAKAEARTTLDSFKSRVDSDPYAEALKNGYGELRNYIVLDSPIALLLKGLVGDSLGSKIVEVFSSKAASLENEFISKVNQKADAIISKHKVDLTKTKAAK